MRFSTSRLLAPHGPALESSSCKSQPTEFCIDWPHSAWTRKAAPPSPWSLIFFSSFIGNSSIFAQDEFLDASVTLPMAGLRCRLASAQLPNITVMPDAGWAQKMVSHDTYFSSLGKINYFWVLLAFHRLVHAMLSERLWKSRYIVISTSAISKRNKANALLLGYPNVFRGPGASARVELHGSFQSDTGSNVTPSSHAFY